MLVASKSFSKWLPKALQNPTHHFSPLKRRGVSSPLSSPSTSLLWLTIVTIFLAFVGSIPTSHALAITSPIHQIDTIPPEDIRRTGPYLILTSPPFSAIDAPYHTFIPRDRFIIANLTSGLQVLDPETRQPIPQGPGTDGSGRDFDAPALLWLAFGFAVGLPLALAGIRGWWVTTGVGLGLAGVVASWAAIINSVGVPGVSDIILTAIVLSFFCLCFICGAFPYGRIAGMVGITLTGGLSLGIRICILKSGLLFSGDKLYSLNWAIIALFGVVSGLGLIWSKYRRAALLFGCTASGTFMTGLAGDLVVNKQAGMSRGLRFLFDRNASHYLDIIIGGYNPPVSAQVIIGVSILLIPILSYGQHRIFSAPFDRTSDANDTESVSGRSDEKRESQRKSIFSSNPKPKPGRPSAASQVQAKPGSGLMSSFRNR
ncbi:hypothetical protein CVT24_007931 [Panaeolus cyanescens]|uniref:TM7S3/TM198-like domain-containing protein n=1 Tax=Panaeolus cyanescens TaxID=181874 RepID=A0A409WRI5_9AGAR|nr:hypothetical protein CVT24_007931 [Panaeolus cyanescens]